MRAADRQAQAGAALLAGVGGVDLLEALEDALELVGRDAATLVAHPEQHVAVGAAGVRDDHVPTLGELDGVAEQVGERLHDPVLVGEHLAGAGPDLEPDPLGGGEALELADRARDELAASSAASSSGRVPDSIRSMSSRSLIRRVSRSVLCSAIVTIGPARGVSSPSLPPASRPREPRIEVSGVRSSWLTTERNSFFIRSTSRRWVTSRKTTTAPRTLVLLDHRAGGDLDREGLPVGADVEVLLAQRHVPAPDRLGDVAARARGRAARPRRGRGSSRAPAGRAGRRPGSRARRRPRGSRT